jgi:hypothetical protein
VGRSDLAFCFKKYFARNSPEALESAFAELSLRTTRRSQQQVYPIGGTSSVRPPRTVAWAPDIMICGSISVSQPPQEVTLTAERNSPVSRWRYSSDMRSDPADWPTSVTCNLSVLCVHRPIGVAYRTLL